MRISQLKNLCWAGNGLVFLGVGFVVLQFVQTYQERGVRTEHEWPTDGDSAKIEQRWPGAVTGFNHIWDTPVDGEVPPPPVKKTPTPTKVDPKSKFRRETEVIAIISHLGDARLTVAFIKHPQVETLGELKYGALRTGQRLGDWTLLGYERKETDDRGIVDVLVFGNDEVEGLVRIEETKKPAPKFPMGPPVIAVKALDPDGLVQLDPLRDRIERPAYRDLLNHADGNHWVVPDEEIRWFAMWGESDVLGRTSLTPKKNQNGDSVGVEVRQAPTIPGQKPGMESSRGIRKGDVIVSINGVAVRSKEDIVLYLRGDGKGLDRYAVAIVSSSGKERTQVYEMQRPRKKLPKQ